MVSLALGSTRDSAVQGLQGAATTAGPGGCVDEDCNGVSVSIARAVVLRHRSWLLYCIRTTTLALPLLLGLVGESQSMVVPLFRHVVDNATTPYKWAAVSLSEPEVQLYSADLNFHVHFTGATYLMYEWFYSSYLIGVSLTALMLFSTNAIVVAVFYFRSRADERTPDPDDFDTTNDNGPFDFYRDEDDLFDFNRDLPSDSDVDMDDDHNVGDEFAASDEEAEWDDGQGPRAASAIDSEDSRDDDNAMPPVADGADPPEPVVLLDQEPEPVSGDGLRRRIQPGGRVEEVDSS